MQVGRILSRFSGDLSIIDQSMPNFYDDSLHFVLILVALMVVIVVFVPWVAPLMAMGTLAYLLQVCTCC